MPMTTDWYADVQRACTAAIAQAERAERERNALREELLALCERLDVWWYEADPEGEIKKGERHPWTEKARALLASG